MAKLTTKARKALPAKDFAGPDRSHARNALARSANKSPSVKADVRRAVAAKYPGMINRGK